MKIGQDHSLGAGSAFSNIESRSNGAGRSLTGCGVDTVSVSALVPCAAGRTVSILKYNHNNNNNKKDGLGCFLTGG
jgi:hypothetical protein